MWQFDVIWLYVLTFGLVFVSFDLYALPVESYELLQNPYQYRGVDPSPTWG